MTDPLRIHFLNVGRGDCIIVQHPVSGNVSMIDVNTSLDLSDSEIDDISLNYERGGILGEISSFERSVLINESLGMTKTFARRQALSNGMRNILAERDITLQNPLEYLQTLGIRDVFRLIITHPDADHFTGLHLLQNAITQRTLSIANFWNIGDTKTQTSFVSDAEKASWEIYQQWKQQAFSRQYRAGMWQQHFNQDITSTRGDQMYVLSPDNALVSDAISRFSRKSDIYNNASFVLLIMHGKAKVILSGDAFGNGADHCPADNPQQGNMPNTWRHILDSSIYNCTGRGLLTGISLLKASHHGLKSGYHNEAVRIMAPKVTVVSEGKKTDNDAQARYPNPLSTRFYGNITADVYQSGDVFLYTEKYCPSNGSTTRMNALGYYFNNNSHITEETRIVLAS